MEDVKCPYCNEGQEINHDDGYGYEEDRVHQQECGHCGKTFTYTTYISYQYDVGQAPCLNGEPHSWKELGGYPPGYMSNFHRCEWCDLEEKKNENLTYNVREDKWR